VCVGILAAELGVEPEETTRQLYQRIVSRPPTTSTPGTVGISTGEPLGDPIVALARDAPLIGREREMDRLRAAVAAAGHGQGGVVAVVGEAGVGKTRLVGELIAEARAAGRRALLGRCHESEQILPFAPWLGIVKAARALAGDTWTAELPPAMRRELGRLLPELLPSDADPALTPDYLMLFEGVSALLARVAIPQPVLVVLEDLHWADEMSARLLAFIGHGLPTWRLLLVATVREEDLIDAPVLRRALAELEGEPHVARLALRALSREDTDGLVQALARSSRDDAALARFGDQVWRASEGNPLVAIEAMRAAVRQALPPGIGGLPLPDRVRDIIRSQLERLAEESRELLALASVVGREFEFGLLHRASGLGEEAVAKGAEELIRRRLLESVGDHLDFTHDRVREAAYGQILPPRRAVLHRRVAEALASLHAADLEPHHLALGRHFFEGEVWDRAVHHLRRAGVGALERFAKREAVACFERALAALGHLPRDRSTVEQAYDIRIELRPALNQSGEIREVLENLRAAQELADELDDDRRRGQVYALMTAQYDEAVVTGTRAREIADGLGDAQLRILATDTLAGAHHARGDYERVIELATDNLARLPPEWVNERFGRFAPTSLYDRAFLVRSLAERGRFEEAMRRDAEAVGLAESTGRVYSFGLVHATAGMLHLLRGDWAKARARLELGMAALRTSDAVLSLPRTVAQAAWALAQLGETDEALSRLREGEQLVEGLAARGIVDASGARYHALGRACLSLGRLDEATRLARRAVEASRLQPGDAAHAQHLLGDIAAHPDRFDPEEGQAHYHDALDLAEPRGLRPLVAHCRFGLGRLRGRLGHGEPARIHLAAAAAMYREMGMVFWLEQVEADGLPPPRA
jgi:tetratricopeptide (TPR) repeat protein